MICVAVSPTVPHMSTSRLKNPSEWHAARQAELQADADAEARIRSRPEAGNPTGITWSLYGMPERVDLKGIHKGINDDPDPIAAAERACRYYNSFYGGTRTIGMRASV